MNDAATIGDCERLQLPGAELLLWPRIDLGIDDRILMRTLIDDCDWRQERITVYGKPYLQPRLSAWYGDLPYRYSGIRLEPRGWTPLLLRIKERVETLTGTGFNSLLLNYYRDGMDGMGMHSDDEPELGERPAIASLSLGETRELVLQHRRRRDLETLKLPLPSSSLLLMQGDTQHNWRHGIRKSRRIRGARLNLTFRKILGDADRRMRA